MRTTWRCRTGLSRLYCFELAFYISSIGMLVFWETRRKDFVVMMTHHIATVVLIALSYHLKCYPQTTFLNSIPRSTQCSYMRKIPAAEYHARANALKRAGLWNWVVNAGVNAIPACRVNADTLLLIRWAGSGGGF